MPLDSDDPDDWTDPTGAWVPQAGAVFGPPSGAVNSAFDPAADPFKAYWSSLAASQAAASAWVPTLFPSVPQSTFNNASPSWPSAQLLGALQTPYAGILEGLREPGAVPQGGILEGLRYLGSPKFLVDRWPSSSSFAQAPASTPTAVPDGRRPIGDYTTGEIAGDAAKSFGVGVGQGALGLLGAGGDAREMIANGVQRAADYLAPGYAPNIGASTSEFLATNPLALALNPLLSGPTSAQLQGGVESVTGPFYQPTTVAGDYAQTVGEFLPGAMLVPEGTLGMRALRYGLLPALSSETAGQLTQGTTLEPWARIAGAIVNGPGSSWRALSRIPSVRLLQNTRAGQVAEDAVGIPRNAPKPQITINTGGIRYPDRVTDKTIEEVKNRAYLAFTAQISDYLDYADQNGLTFILHVRPGIRYSAPLKQLIDTGRIIERPIRGLSR